MNKITLKLTAQDVRIFSGILEYILTGTEINYLRVNKEDYLKLACINELYNRIDKKRREIAQFGLPVKKGGQAPTISISIKRHEAIAFFLLGDNSSDLEKDSLLPAVPDTTAIFLNGIFDEINKAFFV